MVCSYWLLKHDNEARHKVANRLESSDTPQQITNTDDDGDVLALRTGAREYGVYAGTQ